MWGGVALRASGATGMGIRYASSSRERGKAAQAKGHAFEQRVAKLLTRMGYRNVQLNNRLKDSNGNTSEIDITGRRWLRTFYVECKNYNTKTVPLEDVAKFKEVLKLNRISPSRGIFVTNSTYSPRATEIGIRTIDGQELRRLTRKYSVRRSVVGRFLWLLLLSPVVWIGGQFAYTCPVSMQQLSAWDRWESGQNQRQLAEHADRMAIQFQRSGSKMARQAEEAAKGLIK
eukprot:TRINITY_DN17871_c0_g1_i2.p1 TRINITY_DN17871_c0_g1~~TRINITY_DN17871_c0_g1_i2.p1  ORF type:complete len:230 (+),score=40.63 TRINITY_DN17871_c0_g1_i2:242-931(+)